MSKQIEDPEHYHSSSRERSNCERVRCMKETAELNSYLEANPDLKGMSNAFESWMLEHELTPNLHWLTPRQWLDLRFEGEILDGAELVVLFEETELVEFFNYELQDWVIEGLSDVVEKFGYSGILGNIWNMGFYKDADSSHPDCEKKSTKNQSVPVQLRVQ